MEIKRENYKTKITLEIDADPILAAIKNHITEEMINLLIEKIKEELKEIKYSDWDEIREASDLTKAIINRAKGRIFNDYERSHEFDVLLIDKIAANITNEELKNLLISVLMRTNK